MFEGEGVTTADITAAQGLDGAQVAIPVNGVPEGLAYGRPGALRNVWESRYVNALIIVDTIVGLVAAFAALHHN